MKKFFKNFLLIVLFLIVAALLIPYSILALIFAVKAILFFLVIAVTLVVGLLLWYAVEKYF